MIFIVYTWVHTWFRFFECSGRTQRANEKHFSTNAVSVFYEFYQTSLPVCFRGFVCFKLLGGWGGKQPMSFMHHNTEALPLVYHAWRSRWHWCVFSNHIPSSLPAVRAARQLQPLHRRLAGQLLVRVIVYGSEIYLSIFLSIGSIALYICMWCFISVSKCPP